jgi:hypothetical protein
MLPQWPKWCESPMNKQETEKRISVLRKKHTLGFKF